MRGIFIKSILVLPFSHSFSRLFFSKYRYPVQSMLVLACTERGLSNFYSQIFSRSKLNQYKIFVFNSNLIFSYPKFLGNVKLFLTLSCSFFCDVKLFLEKKLKNEKIFINGYHNRTSTMKNHSLFSYLFVILIALCK